MIIEVRKSGNDKYIVKLPYETKRRIVKFASGFTIGAGAALLYLRTANSTSSEPQE